MFSIAIKKSIKQYLSHASIYQMSRRSRSRQIIQHNQLQSKRVKRNMINSLITKCKSNDRQAVVMVLEKEFYDNFNNKVRLAEVIKWKNSVDYYFRDYQSIMMNIENQEILAATYANKQINNLCRLLINMLTNHTKLPQFHKKQPHNSIFPIYIKSLCGFITGEYEHSAVKILQLINMSIDSMVINKDINNQQISQFEQQNKLLGKTSNYQLNFKQQMFFNLMIYFLIRDSQSSELSPNNKKKSIELYRKIKNNVKLQLSDFIIEDFQQFFNIWVSAKSDSPMQWTDMSQEQRIPYYKFIYLLAENSYLNKQILKSVEILSYLPKDYPLRQLLQLSQLFDSNNFKEMRRKFDQISLKKQCNQNKFYKIPQFDIIYLKILQLMKKMQQKITKVKQQHKQMVEQLTEIIKFYRYERGINNYDSKGIPFYYFSIPFQMFLVDDNFYDLFN